MTVIEAGAEYPAEAAEAVEAGMLQREMPECSDTPRLDGRRRRSQRTRQRLIEAFLEIVREKKEHPSVAEIAQKAGCSQRSVFERFESLNLLALAAFDHALQIVPAISYAAQTDRQTRIHLQADLRARICEEWGALWQVIHRLQGELPALQARISGARDFTRKQVDQLCEPELAALAAAERRAVLIAIESVTDFDCWARMREHHGLSFEEARLVWHQAMDRLLPVPAS